MPDMQGDIFADFDEPQRPSNGQDQLRSETTSSAVSSYTETSNESTQDDPSRATAEPSEPSQPALFEKGEWWDEAWAGMPEFVQHDLMPFKSIYVHFETRKDMEDFARLVKQQINLTTRFIWYPEAEIEKVAHMAWVDAPIPLPKVDDELTEIAEGE